MIDSHCHLNFKAFSDDWREVAQRAFLGGVEAIINVGSNLETSKKAIEIASLLPERGYPRVEGPSLHLFATIALHPIHISDEDFDINKYESLLFTTPLTSNSLTSNSPIRAIGETGIDLYHSPDNLSAQREAFIQFINLANKHHLPVIVHNRNAGEEVLSILRSHPPRYGGVMHFFSEDWDYAQKLFDLDLLISFTGAITLGNVDAKTIDVIKKAPLDKVMIETDAPFVVPEPMKSQGVKRNEPLFVAEVARRIAEIKKVDISKVASQTTKNTKNLFHL